MRLTRSDSGLTLIELAVAILVLSIGAIAATRAGDQAQSALSGMQDRALARIVAQNRAEELRLYGTARRLPDTVQMGGRDFTLSETRDSTVSGLQQVAITVRARSGPGARLVTFVRRIGPGL